MVAKRPRLFVGCASESIQYAEALQSCLDEVVEVRLWNQGLLRPGMTIMESLLDLSNEFDFGVFILGNDDVTISRGHMYGSARDNVLLEAGLFYSRLGRERVFLLVEADPDTKVPSDLDGINTVTFRKPSDNNSIAAINPASMQLKTVITEQGAIGSDQKNASNRSLDCHTLVYPNRRSAWSDIVEDCRNSRSISILANRGVIYFGTDDSIVSLADLGDIEQLQKIRMVLLSDTSRWLHDGFVEPRAYDSLEIFKQELEASHLIVESAMRRFTSENRSSKSGVRYQKGEPHFRMLLTDNSAYVSSYAEPA